ncbi:MAG: sialic acid TRAP transporter substrate-binding protein SiaP [Nitrospinota bacterium]
MTRIFLLLFFLVGQSTASAKVILSWGDVLPPGNPSVEASKIIADIVREKSGGRLRINLFSSGQLGSSREMIEAVMVGAQQMVTEGAANIGQVVPALSILEAPYVWRDLSHMKKVLNGPIGESLKEKLRAKTGLRLLVFYYYGERNITTASKPIQKIADIKGFKIRVPENTMFLEMARAWGASPTPMNFAELYLGLRQGVVEGQENPLPTIDSAKFFEVQKYLILTRHVITPRLILINDGVWKRIVEADRKILLAAIDEGIRFNNRRVQELEKTLLDKFKNSGMEIIEPEISGFRDAVLERVPGKFEKKWGRGVFQSIINAQ